MPIPGLNSAKIILGASHLWTRACLVPWYPVTAAELVGCASMALRLDSNVRDPIPYCMLMLDRVRELAQEFDILHFHPIGR
jgi:hypothetical protein